MQMNKAQKKNRACAFCQSRNLKIFSKRVRDSLNHRVVKCKNCGLLQLFPLPTAEEDKKFYDQNRQVKNIKAPTNLSVIKRNSLDDTKRRVKMASSYVKKNQTVLDFASGYGFFVQEMKNLGYKAAGVEISAERRKASAKVTKAEIFNLNLLQDDTALPKFDCITLFHVLEHISAPVSFLKILKRHLNKNGKIIIEVPNADDMLLWSCQGYRDFYWQRAHLFYFNVKTLKKIIQKAGLSIVDISYVQRYGLENFMNWFISGQPQLQKPLFQTKSEYKWLEDYYKKCLSKTGKTDTLILIAKP